ncbi:MAG TPA: protein-L-isoaspartate O-methyltransferase [Acetobacteraceae bacterium]|jgi:protein-L-isoaspartate(D-aspartate) O-methyltransferase|nr:protein-L-isoaspartate O-methyltransferase [Acetobacteraceae bacterium]
MDLPTLDYAAARDHMVDGQIRPNKVVDPRIIRAMRTLPRERFLPPALASQAYIDEDLPLPGGRNFMEPLVLARLVQLARIRQGERVLVVGAGAGYGAAVLASCGAIVTALEEDEALLAAARQVLPSVAPEVTIQPGPLQAGAPGPWDAILIEGAVPEIPAPIGAQLEPHRGRLVTVLAQVEGLGQGVLAEPINPGDPSPVLRAAPQFDCATPFLPQFRKRPGFTF